jgi:hypothetical protein
VIERGLADDDARAIEELGGISRPYLNHCHEAAFGEPTSWLVRPAHRHRDG